MGTYNKKEKHRRSSLAEIFEGKIQTMRSRVDGGTVIQMVTCRVKDYAAQANQNNHKRKTSYGGGGKVEDIPYDPCRTYRMIHQTRGNVKKNKHCCGNF